MKRKLFILLVLMIPCFTLFAQKRAIGARIGYGINVSYQHSLSESNMLEVDAGLPGFFGAEAAVTYDWIKPFESWKEKGAWIWYLGLGAGGGLYGFNEPIGYVGLAGRAGVEYNFWFPLNLSLDWRPLFSIRFAGQEKGFNTSGLWYGAIAISARYRF